MSRGLLILEPLACELERPAVLADSPHDVVRRTGRNLGLDLKRHRHLCANKARQRHNHLVGDSARVAMLYRNYGINFTGDGCYPARDAACRSYRLATLFQRNSRRWPLGSILVTLRQSVSPAGCCEKKSRWYIFTFLSFVK